MERFCKFCGQSVVVPCMDETDLSIYRRTVDRCRDAAFAFDAEDFYDDPNFTDPTEPSK